MAEISRVDEFWRSMRDDDNGTPVATADSTCLPGDEPKPAVKKVKKISKKKKKIAVDPVVIEEVKEPSPEPVPIVEAEEIPHEPTPTECDIPTEPEVVEEPPCDDGQHTQVADDNATVKGEAEDPKPLVYLPFSAQHRLMVFVQHKLEEMCFSFSQRHLPDLLHERGLDCPEALELHKWLRTFTIELPYIGQDWVFKQTKLFDSVAQIRNFAVNRSRIDSAQMEKLMSDAVDLATLLEEEKTVKIIDRLCDDMVSTSKSLGAETEQIKQRFESKLDEIEAARTKLKKLENATKAALERRLLDRKGDARSKIMQSIQKAEAVDQMMESANRSRAMSSLDLVNDLENSLMLDDEGRDRITPSESSFVTKVFS